ncbi:MarR family winged helix-turn-helix transcriptional regulator [Lysinibacillus varians]|uniref:MarR family winged helix-turn-helix transcriptional regulator n=1 Tax=Lysinibacillus varians TaxID=1145276 RepID=UPI00042F15B3|nr:MarR family transcriptional regulator [Lysinibacillus varians]AHN21740.1 transcriptional regulator [Lysinibacillus varians]
MKKIKAFLLEDQLCFAVYKAANQFTKLYRQVLEPFGLTYPQYLVLLALWGQDSLVVKQISEKLSLGIGTLNPILNKLVDKGWVTKETSSKDKRAVIISLTEKARATETLITEKLVEKMAHCDALTVIDGDLRAQLQNLNELLTQLNNMEVKDEYL